MPRLDAESSEFLVIPLHTAFLIEFLIDKLNINGGPGLDALPNLLLVHCIQYISLPLCIIFNKSLEECYYPHLWKEDPSFPILKSRDLSQPLSQPTSFQDLGIIIGYKLRFDPHFVNIINCASKSDFILRSYSDLTSIQPSLTYLPCQKHP